ncbi:GntR family transcriptional regulator [Azospirillum griseum]|uniref:GntR family transcriptional regulator n=1 Tax=Azospirillum griseum TaxID=2496639 RepID=A0A431VCW8_9PROT|nr:GntR family transcriptional regulator [Azospirillum griseum]RTR16904.1 GntR family transcriptional regulator [Azospirillum griseum]
MADTPTEDTLANVAVQRIIDDIVSGQLEPCAKLRIESLKEQYGMGASPLREALSRLSTLGFVTNESHRGFRVAPMSQADLEDITLNRRMVEREALLRSLTRDDDEWEVGVVAAYTRLERTVERLRTGQGADGADLERAHKQFHTAIVAHCGSPRLLGLHDTLYDQAQRYRRLMMRGIQDLDEFLAHHTALLKALLGGDADAAVHALTDHLNLTLTSVYPND